MTGRLPVKSIQPRSRKERYTPERECRLSAWAPSAPTMFPRISIAEAVKAAARCGYRHFDCASVYGNEAEIGGALAEVMATGVKREELWITSKLWNDKHAPHDVIASCEKSLADLRLSYLDLYLVHWPFPNFHPPGCDVSARSKDSKPYIHADYMKTWAAMEELHQAGASPPHWHVQYDHSQAQAGAP